MNLGEIRAAVDRRSGVAFDATALNDLINEALMKLSLQADWPWLYDIFSFTATTGVGSQALPAGVGRVDAVNIGGYEGFLAAKADLDAWDVSYSTCRSSYAVRNGTLTFRPTQVTGTAIAVSYYGSETRLVDDSDEPLLPGQHQDALIDLAAGLALERAGNLARARILTDRFDQWVKDMRRTALRTSGNSGRIRVRPGGGI